MAIEAKKGLDRKVVGADLGIDHRFTTNGEEDVLIALVKTEKYWSAEYHRMFNSLGGAPRWMQERIDQGLHEARESRETARMELKFVLGPRLYEEYTWEARGWSENWVRLKSRGLI